MYKQIIKCSCDYCGNVTEYDNLSEYAFGGGYRQRKINGVDYDLCPDCAKSYDQFMEEVADIWLNQKGEEYAE